MDEIASLKAFRWNVLQAFDRGGESYLWDVVDWLVKEQALDVDRIVAEEKPE